MRSRTSSLAPGNDHEHEHGHLAGDADVLPLVSAVPDGRAAGVSAESPVLRWVTIVAVALVAVALVAVALVAVALVAVALVAVALVAVVAAVVSYAHMYELAHRAGEGWRAWLLPLAVDGLILTSSPRLKAGGGSQQYS